MVNKTKDILLLLLKISISFGLIFFLVWSMRGNIKDVLQILKDSNKMFIILALSTSVPLTLGMSYRLRMLMARHDIYLSLRYMVYLVFIGYFFNNFLPTSIGGDIVKAYYASKKTNNKAASYASVFVDRLLGFIACLSVAIIGLFFIGTEIENKGIVWGVVALTAFVALTTALLLNKKGLSLLLPGFTKKGTLGKIREKLSKLYNAVNYYRHDVGLLLRAYILALAMQAISVVSVLFFIWALGGTISMLKLFLIIPIVWAISMLPSLNGLGLREGAFVYFLKGDIGSERAFAISVLWLGMIILYSIIGGALHLLYPVNMNEINERGEI